MRAIPFKIRRNIWATSFKKNACKIRFSSWTTATLVQISTTLPFAKLWSWWKMVWLQTLSRKIPLVLAGLMLRLGKSQKCSSQITMWGLYRFQKGWILASNLTWMPRLCQFEISSTSFTPEIFIERCKLPNKQWRKLVNVYPPIRNIVTKLTQMIQKMGGGWTCGRNRQADFYRR